MSVNGTPDPSQSASSFLGLNGNAFGSGVSLPFAKFTNNKSLAQLAIEYTKEHDESSRAELDKALEKLEKEISAKIKASSGGGGDDFSFGGLDESA